jgi:hypothetical protein
MSLLVTDIITVTTLQIYKALESIAPIFKETRYKILYLASTHIENPQPYQQYM